MNFTSTTPTEPGAYWWKVNEDDKRPDLVKVFEHDRELVILEAGFDGHQAMKPFVGGLWSEPLEPRKPKCVWKHVAHSIHEPTCENVKGLTIGKLNTTKWCEFCGGEIEIK